MSETALVHPLIAGYLILFDAEAAILPVNRARELREQVVAHIEDAVGPDASDEEIAAVLRGLGPPRLLVAEAVAATGKRHWAARVGWKGWAVIGVLLLVVAAVSGYYIKAVPSLIHARLLTCASLTRAASLVAASSGTGIAAPASAARSAGVPSRARIAATP